MGLLLPVTFKGGAEGEAEGLTMPRKRRLISNRRSLGSMRFVGLLLPVTYKGEAEGEAEGLLKGE